MAVLSIPNSTPFEVRKEKNQLFEEKAKEMREKKLWQKRLLAHKNGDVKWKTSWK